MGEWLLEPTVGLPYALALVSFVTLAALGLRRGSRWPWLTAFAMGTLAGLIASLPSWTGDRSVDWYIGSLISTLSIFGLPLAVGAAVGALFFRRSKIVVRIGIATTALLLCIPVSPYVGLIGVCWLTDNCL